jgi:3-oxoacyl-[acyl-carrier protein] reductase
VSYFDRRTVLITGAGHGIGAATARRLAAAGACLALADIDLDSVEQVAKDVGGTDRVRPFALDVTDDEQIRTSVERIVGTFGALTDLVNCAGGVSGLAHPHRRSIESLPIEEWDAAFDLNVKSVFLCSRAVVAALRAEGGGAIVNVASSAARQGSVQAGPAYVASKAAVIGLTRQMAGSLARDRIRVNAIAPGGTESERFVQAMADRPPDEVAAGLARIPLHRHGRPNEMASAIQFLLSEESAYITGCTLDVNGGTWFA